MGLLIRFAFAALFTVMVAIGGVSIAAGIQVTTCDEGPVTSFGIEYRYRFFACTPNVRADELSVTLLDSEVQRGVGIVGCEVPAGNFAWSVEGHTATFRFSEVAPFQCVPAIPGDANKFVFLVESPHEAVLVTETWKRNGQVVASFYAVFACPPVAVERETWGRIKSLYR